LSTPKFSFEQNQSAGRSLRASAIFRKMSFLVRPATLVIKGFLTLIFFLSQTAYSQPTSDPRGPVAFVEVSVVPMDSDRILPNQTVVTSGGQIVAIGPAQSVQIPKNAKRIDGKGRFLMPGLADMHVHLNRRGSLKDEDFALLFLANGVTTVRSMRGNEDFVAFRRSIESGQITGPQIYSTGPITDGSPPVMPASRVVQTPEAAIQAVDQDKRDGFDGIKVYNKLATDVYEALVSRARSVGLPVYGHVPDAVGIFGVLAARQASIEHVDGYLNSLDKDESQENKLRLVAETVKAGTWNCVTLVFFQGIVNGIKVEKLLGKPSMRFIPLAMRDRWRNDPRRASLTEYQIVRIRLYDQKRLDFVRALHAGGARLLVGTDTPNPFVVPGFSVHEELANLIDVGLTPFEAIRAATSGAAEFLKAQKEWGRVAEGLRADLLLVEGNPLQDVANANRRVGVMVRGHWMPETEIHQSLERIAISYGNLGRK
jgi:imidazolonepropionase-like amidohydrolase